MSIQSIQAKYPSAIWFDSNYVGTNSGTLAQPYDDLAVAIANSDTNAKVIAIKDGSHNVSQIGGNGTTSTFSFAGTATKLSLVGESTDAVLNFSGTNFGTAINFRGETNSAIHLETLKLVQNSTGTPQHRVIFGGNDASSTINVENCILEMGSDSLSASTNAGWFGGPTSQVTTLSISNSVISGATSSASNGLLISTSDVGGFSVFNVENSTIINVSGSSNTLSKKGSFTSSIFKNNIFVGAGNSEVLGFTPSVSGGNCFHNTGISSGNGGVVFADPLFVDSANGDYRLRPSSPCINAGTAS